MDDIEKILTDFRSKLVGHIASGQASLGFLLWAGRVLQEAYEIDGGGLTDAVSKAIEKLAG